MPVEPNGPVLVGVNGSPGSSAAVTLAAEEALGRVTPLVVLHVGGDLEEADRLAGEARCEHPGLSVSATAVPDRSSDVLLAMSRDACLLVVAGGVDVAGRLAEEAPVPVIVHRSAGMVVRDGSPSPVAVAVVALGGCEHVVEFAFGEAALRGAPLLAVHVWSRPADIPPAVPAYDPALARGHAERMLAEAVEPWSLTFPDVPVCWTTKHSLDTAAALRAVAHSSQLLVVGRMAHAGATRPVPADLIRDCARPIAVVPRDLG